MTFARVAETCKTVRRIAGIGMSIERLSSRSSFGLAAEDNKRIQAVVDQMKDAVQVAITQIIALLNESK